MRNYEEKKLMCQNIVMSHLRLETVGKPIDKGSFSEGQTRNTIVSGSIVQCSDRSNEPIQWNYQGKLIKQWRDFLGKKDLIRESWFVGGSWFLETMKGLFWLDDFEGFHQDASRSDSRCVAGEIRVVRNFLVFVKALTRLRKTSESNFGAMFTRVELGRNINPWAIEHLWSETTRYWCVNKPDWMPLVLGRQSC